jgi:hypothetical protein
MTDKQKEIAKKLETLLNECLNSYNQEGTFKITFIDEESGKGTAEFTWCMCEGEPYFNGY